MLVQVVVPGNVEEQRLFGAIAAFLKTAHLENPNLMGQVIEVRENFATWCDGLAGKLQENRQRCRDSHVFYRDGTRLVATWERLATLPEEATPGSPALALEGQRRVSDHRRCGRTRSAVCRRDRAPDKASDHHFGGSFPAGG